MEAALPMRGVKEEFGLSALEILRTQSLTSVVQHEIERMILDGEFEPHSRVKEKVLASQLGVSRGPVREACRALATVGLLDITPSRGYSVRSLNEEDVAEVYEARAGLCGYAGMLLIDRLKTKDLIQLKSLVDKMDKLAMDGDVDRYYRLNLEFHHTLISMTGNSRLVQIHEGLVQQLHLARVWALSQAGALMASNSEHREIVEVLPLGNAQQAYNAMMNHVMASRKLALMVMKGS